MLSPRLVCTQGTGFSHDHGIRPVIIYTPFELRSAHTPCSCPLANRLSTRLLCNYLLRNYIYLFQSTVKCIRLCTMIVEFVILDMRNKKHSR